MDAALLSCFAPWHPSKNKWEKGCIIRDEILGKPRQKGSKRERGVRGDDGSNSKASKRETRKSRETNLEGPSNLSHELCTGPQGLKGCPVQAWHSYVATVTIKGCPKFRIKGKALHLCPMILLRTKELPLELRVFSCAIQQHQGVSRCVFCPQSYD
ncbi:unnamed protein product [Sphenostylis stenocarpa]|uniref:Uncharacterized protein n=1 Tax=Sphenostylis stenocarpa TaxID=92480 RepID=A0AA86SRF2_9FABA|nr:unnamed protein product [Sphenostylis stenocarpa]